MKKIEIILQTTWESLSPKNRRYAFRLLMLLMANIITPFEFQQKMFFAICNTNFIKPKKQISRRLWYFFTNKTKFKNLVSAYKYDLEFSKILMINIAENLNFAFKIDGKTININYDFAENPFPNIAAHTPTFSRNITVETNITARQFSDTLDTLRAINDDVPAEMRRFLLIKIAEILYKIPNKTAEKLPEEVLFGISLWFSSISLFFKNHPIYSILFRKKEGEIETAKISLGMSETILHLQKEGYGKIDEMNVIDFFNAQIKSLKDSLSASIASGAKKDEIVKNTGLDYATIEKLI
ncbi:MAG: hypothetical protein LBS50_08555 [Prevotellaceae bacterium]|jgi:hypothetical protein|nr:hypothetical protein [Prevotellaceae bacterium]